MPRLALRTANRLIIGSVLGFALLAPATVLAADPAASDAASAQPSQSAPAASGGGVVTVDPTFIVTPTDSPSGSVLAATGRPVSTPPATDASAATRPASRDVPGLLVPLLALATISLAVARMPGVRSR